MQLYSVEQKRSQALEAHAAAFSTIKVLSVPVDQKKVTMLAITASLWFHCAYADSMHCRVTAELMVCLFAAGWGREHSHQFCSEDIC